MISDTNLPLWDATDDRIKKWLDRYRVILDNLRDLVCIHKPDGTYAWVSPSSLSVTGYRAEELIGKSPYDFFHPDDLIEIRKIHDAALDGSDTEIEYRFRTKSGRYIWVETLTRPIYNGSVKPIAVQTHTREITDKIETAKALEQQAFQLQAIWDSAPIGQALVSLSGAIIKANRHLEEMFGYLGLGLQGKTFHELTHPDDLQTDADLFDRLLKREITEYNIEKRYIHKSGKIVWGHLFIAAHTDDTSTVDMIVAQIVNITKEKQALKALEEELGFHDLLFKNALVPMATFSPKGYFLDVNMSWEELVGYSAAELRKMTFMDLTHPEDAHKDKSNMDDLQNNVASVESVKRFIHKSGRSIPVYIWGGTIKNDKGEILWMTAQAQGLDHIHKLEESLDT